MHFTRHLNLPANLLSVVLAGFLLATTATAATVSPTTVHKPSHAAAKTTVAKPAHVKKPRKVTPKMQAARARQKQCGQEWRRDKAAGKTKNLTWPKYWHLCSQRLKAKA